MIVYYIVRPGAWARAESTSLGGFLVKSFSIIALVLMVVGALNWGLWGIFQFDLVAALFGGNTSVVSRIVYSLVGLAGIVGLTLFNLLLGRTREPVRA
jgi:uncharacterized protein